MLHMRSYEPPRLCSQMKKKRDGPFANPMLLDCRDDDLFYTLGMRPGPKIEEGSSATIVLAYPYKGEQPVKAFKVFWKESLHTKGKWPFRWDIFLREVAIMQGLDHPNVMCQIFAGYCTKYCAIRMKYCPNGDLLEWTLMRGWKDNVNTFHKFTAQLACAVRYLHSMGISHGDIKLENCLIDENNDLILSDFGHAQVVTPTSDWVTEIGGTLPYLAPEVEWIRYGKPLHGFKVLQVLLLL